MPDIAEKRAQERDLVAAFIHGDVWTWLKGHLIDQQRQLIELAADPRLSPEQRALLCGQLGVVSAILAKPERIFALAENARKLAKPSAGKRPAPQVTPD